MKQILSPPWPIRFALFDTEQEHKFLIFNQRDIDTSERCGCRNQHAGKGNGDGNGNFIYIR